MLSKTLARDERRLTATRDGGAEIDADRAFRQVVAVIDNVLKRSAASKAEISTAASCTFWHSLMGIGDNGKPTTPVYGWADNRSRDFVDVLRQRFDESETHKSTGARFHPSFWPAKLLWIRKVAPETWSKTDKWISFGDYVSLKLFGRLMTSVSIASGTGVFDLRGCVWNAELLRFIKLPSNKLPDISPDDNFTLKLLEKWRRRWPRLATAAWTLPIADGVANSVGSGCADETRAALMIGTSGALRVIYKGAPPAKIPNGLWCYRVDRERVIVGGALSDGGGLYDWLKRNLRVGLSDSALEKELKRRRADSHGLTFMPFLAGERSTGYNENATGSIHGLTMAHDAIDISHAGMESVAYRLSDIFNQIESIFRGIEIVASGGALNASPAWTQIIADVFGRNISLSSASEASLHGAVLLALESTGKILLKDKISTAKQKQIIFHSECHSTYIKAKMRHQKFYENHYQTQ